MTRTAKIAGVVLGLMLAVSLASRFIPGLSYSEQHREFTSATPSLHFPLGTDDLGRDRFARLLYATHLSLLLAAGASVGCLAIAALIGGVAGYCGGWADRCL